MNLLSWIEMCEARNRGPEPVTEKWFDKALQRLRLCMYALEAANFSCDDDSFPHELVAEALANME
jgi:hypothetical protein